jgi:hypothetical protein
MSRFAAALLTALLPLASLAGAPSRPASLESLEPLPDGSMKVVVTSWLVRPDGSHRPSVNMRAKLEEAAAYACKGGTYDLQGDVDTGLIHPKRGGLKASMSGVIRCTGSASNNSFKPKPLRGSA